MSLINSILWINRMIQPHEPNQSNDSTTATAWFNHMNQWTNHRKDHACQPMRLTDWTYQLNQLGPTTWSKQIEPTKWTNHMHQPQNQPIKPAKSTKSLNHLDQPHEPTKWTNQLTQSREQITWTNQLNQSIKPARGWWWLAANGRTPLCTPFPYFFDLY